MSGFLGELNSNKLKKFWKSNKVKFIERKN
jgi:hypothetical protein